jgi:glutamate N-acetyltransferase/amino-acid acetyltransferase
MNIINEGVTAPKGFQASGIYAGIKKKKKDMALIYSDVPCIAAGVFTLNVVKAAPVIWDKKVIENSDHVQAVIINSGIANACTGDEGYGYCEETANEVNRVFGIDSDNVLLASTGIIGKQLPIDMIKNGISILAENMNYGREAAKLAAEAIMTTDTKPKEVAVEVEIGGKKVTIAGMCKGSGMIHPNMATMLCFVTTDANISKELLQEVLSEDVKDTFNMISVDGDTSTNDTVLVMANGQAGNAEITDKNEEYVIFYNAFHYVMEELSKMIAGDGEGATCLFEVTVVNAKSKEQAVTLSKSVVTSSLTKSAIFGHDANWGRILCAMGYSGALFNPDLVDIYFESLAGKLKIVENGKATDYSEKEATAILSQEKVIAFLDIKEGNATATAWGCDLTFDYIKINADYRS